jgi:hypothetical protein
MALRRGVCRECHGRFARQELVLLLGGVIASASRYPLPGRAGMDCFVAALLAMTTACVRRLLPLHSPSRAGRGAPAAGSRLGPSRGWDVIASRRRSNPSPTLGRARCSGWRGCFTHDARANGALPSRAGDGLLRRCAPRNDGRVPPHGRHCEPKAKQSIPLRQSMTANS